MKSAILSFLGGKESKDSVREPQKHVGHISGKEQRADGKVLYGYSLLRGKRSSMEDVHFGEFTHDKYGNLLALFGVFDGHGGVHAAQFVKKHLFDNLLKSSHYPANPQEDTEGLRKAIEESFTLTDAAYLEEQKTTNTDDGCTAVIACILGNKLWVAHVGDSRAVLSSRGEAKALSSDHKPSRPDERERIENAGGVVVWAGTWRVGGVLAVSRAFGDRLLKQYVVATPEVDVRTLKGDDEWLILATDGLWDVISNQEAVSLIKDFKDPERAAIHLTDTAYNRGSPDNIGCIVLRFNF